MATTYRLPVERLKYSTPVRQPHIDVSLPCRMDNCTLYHALVDDLPGKFRQLENLHHIRSTSTGFTFLFDRDGKVYKATCLYGSKTGKKIYRFDEAWLKTKNLAKARATMKPFMGTWFIEKIEEHRSKPMTEKDKERLAKRPKGVGEGGRGLKRRTFSQ